jgi:hypothetical protein
MDANVVILRFEGKESCTGEFQGQQSIERRVVRGCRFHGAAPTMRREAEEQNET